MRPASEIHSAIDALDAELAARTEPNLTLVRDVLAWVAGGHWADLTAGPNAWLCAFLLDDPRKIDDTSPEIN